MDQRKVQVTGGGTFFVTLPKAWATRVKIERGSEVSVMENTTGSLLVVPHTLAGENRVLLSLEGKDLEWIERAVISCYITGFDIIEINGARISPQQRRAVRQVSQSLVGLEILDEVQDRIVLHCLVSMRDFAAEATLRRIHAITQAMLRDAVTAFCTRDIDLASDVIERDAEADRLTRVMSRELGLLLRDLLLEEEIGMSRILFHEYHAAAKVLERIGDHAVKVSRTVSSLDEPPPVHARESIEALASAALDIVAQSMQAFFDGEQDQASRVLRARGRTADWEQRARAAEAAWPTLPLGGLLESLLRIRDYGFNVAEMALDMEIPRLKG
jgi:phosphate uptake regulator